MNYFFNQEISYLILSSLFKGVVSNLSEPSVVDTHTYVIDINRTESCITRLRQALKNIIHATNVKIEYLRNAIDLESEVRER